MAQDPTNYEDIKGEHALNEEEIECLRGEILHKWKQPRALYMTIIACSIGFVSTLLNFWRLFSDSNHNRAAVQGWDQTGTSSVFEQCSLCVNSYCMSGNEDEQSHFNQMNPHDLLLDLRTLLSGSNFFDIEVTHCIWSY